VTHSAAGAAAGLQSQSRSVVGKAALASETSWL